MSTQPNYGNWVAARLVYVPLTLALLLGVAALWLPLLALPAALLLLCAAYFAYARYRFSPGGGDLQGRIQDLVPAHLAWDGEGQALDIGCGSGRLVIALAKAHERARISGIDFWGASWEYSQGVCRRNAELEGVAQRVVFQQAGASALPFADGAFDAVVSNLTFHEVRDTADKRALVREALRVLKPGGAFAFQDLFLWRRIYGDVDALVAEVKGWGAAEVRFEDTSRLAWIPRALKLPFMVGTMGILYGRK
ncbi:MAG: class I SAM-dependent methyltransferase [Anaerolineae bacterium]